MIAVALGPPGTQPFELTGSSQKRSEDKGSLAVRVLICLDHERTRTTRNHGKVIRLYAVGAHSWSFVLDLCGYLNLEHERVELGAMKDYLQRQ
jgi:hypothetical protein